VLRLTQLSHLFACGCSIQLLLGGLEERRGRLRRAPY
jgi:hypothetical protein